MNEKQKQWLEQKIKQLNAMFDIGRIPTDDELEKIIQFVDQTVEQAKGKTEDKRTEVRQILLDVLEEQERRIWQSN